MSFKYKRLAFFLTLGIMGLGLATFTFTPSSFKNDEIPVNTSYGYGTAQPSAAPLPSVSIKEPSAAPSVDPAESPAPLISPVPKEGGGAAVPVVLLQDAYEEVNQLITAYLHAKLDPASSYVGLVSSPSQLDPEKLAAESEVIKGFHGLTCYTVQGVDEVAFVVYAAYDAEILMLSSLVPSIDEFYLSYDKEGRLVIYNDGITDGTSAYIDRIRADDKVKALLADTERRFMEAVAGDRELADFFDKISQGAE